MNREIRDSKRLKVVHLNASSAGGAFVAAQRLSVALDQLPGVDSEHWVFEGGEGDFHLWASNWFKSKWAFGLHALEKLDFLRFERDKSVRFAFSHGKTGVNVSAWEAISDADVIHLHWVNKGFVSLNRLGGFDAFEQDGWCGRVTTCGHLPVGVIILGAVIIFRRGVATVTT
jgi:hypothetical protein